MFHMNEIYTVRKKLNLNFFSHDAKLLVHEQSNPTENDILNNFITKLKANNNFLGGETICGDETKRIASPKWRISTCTPGTLYTYSLSVFTPPCAPAF